ncbi:MAG: hypothetical protein MJD61_02575 [Proteobacteria bacterium]|nr:hypothetical protein [Pseudomonadota bacterium]
MTVPSFVRCVFVLAMLPIVWIPDAARAQAEHGEAVDQMTDDEAYYSPESRQVDEQQAQEDALEEEEPEEPSPFAPPSDGVLRVQLPLAFRTGAGLGFGLQGGYEQALFARLGPGRLTVGGLAAVVWARRVQVVSGEAQGTIPAQEELTRGRAWLPIQAFARYVLEADDLLRPWALAGTGLYIHRINDSKRFRLHDQTINNWGAWSNVSQDAAPGVGWRFRPGFALSLGCDLRLSDSMLASVAFATHVTDRSFGAVVLGLGNRM